MNDEAFGWWLTGLADGEGHFGITRSQEGGRSPFFRCVFRVSMVADDAPLLEMAQARTGWGKLYRYASRDDSRRPYCVWTTTTKCVGEVVEHFERFPLQSKKAAEFEMWAPAARAQVRRARRGRGHRDEEVAQTMETAYEALRALDRGGRLAVSA